MAPNPQTLSPSFADRKATLDTILEEIQDTASTSAILVKIKDSDSFDSIKTKIKTKINTKLTTLNDDRQRLIANALNDATNSLYGHNLSYYASKEGIEDNISKIISIIFFNDDYLINPSEVKYSIPQITTFITTFEGDLQKEIASTTFKIPKGALVTNVMLTSTSTGRHFHLPTSEVQNFAASALYAPVDAAGLTSVSFKPADYDLISGMADQIKAVTVSYVTP